MGQGKSKQVVTDPLHKVKGQLSKNTAALSRKLVDKNKAIKTKEKQLLKAQTERQTLMNRLEYLKQTNVVSAYQLPVPVNTRRNARANVTRRNQVQ